MAIMTIMSSAALAESSIGTAEALHIHDHFSMVTIRGETAQKIYEKMQVSEKEDVNGLGQHMGSYAKVSVDGRIACQRIPQGADYYIPAAQGTFNCSFTFDTTSGAINQTYSR